MLTYVLTYVLTCMLASRRDSLSPPHSDIPVHTLCLCYSVNDMCRTQVQRPCKLNLTSLCITHTLHRYLYLGQHPTVATAAATRDAAMLAVYGRSGAPAFGEAWLSAEGAQHMSDEAVEAMAVRLSAKPEVREVMLSNGTWPRFPPSRQAPAGAVTVMTESAGQEEAAAAAAQTAAQQPLEAEEDEAAAAPALNPAHTLVAEAGGQATASALNPGHTLAAAQGDNIQAAGLLATTVDEEVKSDPQTC